MQLALAFSAFLLLHLGTAIEIESKTYDYVVVGGGTAGLTIAARLTENPNISVVVLEAGGDHTNDVNVLAPGLLTALYGNPEYDWNYKTTPQSDANGQIIAHPRGKQLGGSSAINFLFWTHASQQDIDNWGLLGNKGWSWDALAPYYKKSEHYIAPSARIEKAFQTSYLDPRLHGKHGPIINKFPDIYGPFDTAWPRTYKNLGLAVTSDPRDGLALGGYTNLLNLDTATGTRRYAANNYYVPVAHRKNLKVITGAHVVKVVLTKDSQGVSATGIKYSRNGSTTIDTLHASREVIVCAGSVGSPQLLELSGIGQTSVLKKQGIDTVVENDNVGENLQDHIYVPIAYEVVSGIFTLDDFNNPKVFNRAYKQYLKNGTGLLSTTSASSALLSLRQIQNSTYADHRFEKTNSRPGLAEQYKLLYRDLHSQAVTQELTIPGGISPQFSNDTTKLFTTSTDGNFFTLLGVLEHPFSRGSIHIQSPDPLDYPKINPKYLSHSLDLEILNSIALHLQIVAKTAPLSHTLKGNGTVYQPGYHKLNSDNVSEWVRKYLQSEYHLAGTCAMMPRDEGGVVDAEFRVYGVDKLRVVDASIFPLLPRANLQTLVYAIAERAADFIRGSDLWRNLSLEMAVERIHWRYRNEESKSDTGHIALVGI